MVFGSFAHTQGVYDNLGEVSTELVSAEAVMLFESKINDLKSIIENFHFEVDENTKIISAERIEGTTANPAYTVSLKKCVFSTCKKADLGIDFTLSQESGSCDKNIILIGDLQHSSALVSQLYSDIRFEICFMNQTGGGSLTLNGLANRAPNYSKGFVQHEVLGLMQRQTPAILKALKTTLEL